MGGGISHSSFASGTSSQNTSDRVSSSSLISGLANMQIERSIKKSYKVFTGLTYHVARAHISRTTFSSVDERDVSLDYLMVPVGISRKLFSSKAGIGWCSLAGYAAYAISGYEKGLFTFSGNNPSVVHNKIYIQSNNADRISPTVVVPFDFGLNAEVGFDCNRIRICAKYLRGFKGVMANPGFYDSKYFNQIFTLSVNFQAFTFK